MNFREMCIILEEILPPTDYYRFIDLYNALSVNEGYVNAKIAIMLEHNKTYMTYIEKCYVLITEEDQRYVKELVELLDGFLWYATVDHKREEECSIFCAYTLYSIPVNTEE